MDEESTMTKKRTVAVAMDGSQQAESAFNCKKIICIIYVLYIIILTIYVTRVHVHII